MRLAKQALSLFVMFAAVLGISNNAIAEDTSKEAKCESSLEELIESAIQDGLSVEISKGEDGELRVVVEENEHEAAFMDLAMN